MTMRLLASLTAAAVIFGASSALAADTYRSGSNSRLALYGEDGGNWTGIWSYGGAKTVGAEHWKRQ